MYHMPPWRRTIGTPSAVGGKIKTQEPGQQGQVIRTFVGRTSGEIYPTETDSFGAFTNHIPVNCCQRSGGDTSRSKKSLSRLCATRAVYTAAAQQSSFTYLWFTSSGEEGDAAAFRCVSLSPPFEQN